jgi:ABC-2 type transport system ATP-binding protein
MFHEGSNMNGAIQIDKVTKRFRNAVALDNVSFSIPQGEIFGLLGPNGAGKTTLMRILVGIIGPDEGCIHLPGESSRRLKERIGYLPEERGLYPKMRVKQLLRYFASMKGMSGRDLNQQIEDGLERVGIPGEGKRKVEELSKGNQQRVQLLATLLHKPDFLVLDEPFTGLDPVGVEQMKVILTEEIERGATVIISTHRMNDAEELCGDIALIDRGRVIRSGCLDKIKREEGCDELAVEFEGDSRCCEDVPGISLLECDNHTLRLRIENGATVPEIVKDISNRIDVYSIVRMEPTLHDIFVQLVGRKEDQ